MTGGEQRYIRCTPLQLIVPDGRHVLVGVGDGTEGRLLLQILVPTLGSSLHFPFIQIN